MVNPWTKKNTLLCMWLSGTNAVAGKARSAATAEAKRRQTGVAKQAVGIWSGAWLADAKPETKKVEPKRRR